MKLLVSACLMGVHCRYDGKSNPLPQLSRLLEEYTCIPVCPELLGGLPTPRVPAERRKDRIINQQGEDVTEAYVRGSAETLRLAKLCGCDTALLKERSPSCGCGTIYDGTFSGRLTAGDGLTAQTLKRFGITVYGESEIENLLPEDDLIFGTMMGFREEVREEERAALRAAKEAAEAQAKAEAEAAEAQAKAEAEAAAKAAEEAAAAKAAEDAAIADALADDNVMPFGDFSKVETETFVPEDDDSNPFAGLMALGALERVPKPEPKNRPMETKFIVLHPKPPKEEGEAETPEEPVVLPEDDDPDGNPFAALMKKQEAPAPEETPEPEKS